jgi:ASPIC and UnbV
MRAHFGLGTADRVEAIEILWPDGTAECFPGGPANRSVLLQKGRGVRQAN